MKLKINNIDVFIFNNGIEYKKNGIYDAEYSFLIENKKHQISKFKDEKTFCEKVALLPKIDLKQNQVIKSVQIKLIKYLSNSFVK